MNLRPPRPERGALPDCATLRLPEGRPYNRLPPAPQAQVSAMSAPPATRVIKAQAARDGTPEGGATAALAARVLAAGGLVAFPTETVYGLGADATNAEAVARLYEAKGRPSFNPLIAHVTDAAAARALARLDPDAERLAAAFWPGPLTLVLPRRSDCPVAELATAGLDTIAVRVPSHPVARDILAAVGRPLVAPSANRSGHVSPTTAQHVLADLCGRIELIVDGGPTPMGIESTIVACLDPAVLLRPGALPRAQIERVVHLGKSTSTHADAGRWRPENSPPTMPRGRGCGSTRKMYKPARRCSPSARSHPRVPSAPL